MKVPTIAHTRRTFLGHASIGVGSAALASLLNPRIFPSGEIVRDQALALSGLLAPTLGGPPLRPYHPAGMYETMAPTSADTLDPIEHAAFTTLASTLLCLAEVISKQ